MASRVEAAAHLFLGVDQFDRLRRSGSLPKSRGRAGYDLDACRRMYIESLKSKRSEEPVPPDDMADAKTRSEQLKVEKQEMEIAKAKGELLPAELLEDYAGRVANAVRDLLEALPGRCKRRIPHLRAAEVRMIQSECSKTGDAIADLDLNDKAAA